MAKRPSGFLGDGRFGWLLVSIANDEAACDSRYRLEIDDDLLGHVGLSRDAVEPTRSNQ